MSGGQTPVEEDNGGAFDTLVSTTGQNPVMAGLFQLYCWQIMKSLNWRPEQKGFQALHYSANSLHA